MVNFNESNVWNDGKYIIFGGWDGKDYRNSIGILNTK